MRTRLHARQVLRGDDAAGGVDQPQVQRHHVAGRRRRRACVSPPSHGRRCPRTCRARHRAPTPPRACRKPWRSRPPRDRCDRSRTRQRSCRASVCPTPACQRPCFMDATCSGNWRAADQHQRPGELGRRVGRLVGVGVGAHHHAMLGAGGDVDVRVHAALADELQLRQLRDQLARDPRAFADQHQRLGVGQPRRPACRPSLGESFQTVTSMPGEQRKARQLPQRVEPVVEDGDLHGVSGNAWSHSLRQPAVQPVLAPRCAIGPWAADGRRTAGHRRRPTASGLRTGGR